MRRKVLKSDGNSHLTILVGCLDVAVRNREYVSSVGGISAVYALAEVGGWFAPSPWGEGQPMAVTHDQQCSMQATQPLQ